MTSPEPARWKEYLRPRLLLVLVSILVLGHSLQLIYPRITSPYPIDMWESATLETAARLAHGEPYYAHMKQPGGILPTLYTPLQTITLSHLVPLFGLSYVPDRTINLAAGLIVLAISVLVIWRSLSPSTRLAGAALLVAANLELGGTWTGPRGDAIPLCAGLLYICAMNSALKDNRWGLLVVAVLLLQAAFWWKQTALIFTLIPGAFVALDPVYRKQLLKWLMALLPGAVLFLTILVACWAIPSLYEVSFKGPAHLRIQPHVMLAFAVSLVSSLGFYWLIFAWSAAAESPRPKLDTAGKWALAVLLVGSIPALLAAAKIGGGGNSFVFCVHALIFLTVPIIERIMAWAEKPGTALASSAIILALVSLNFLHLPNFNIVPFWPIDLGGPYGDEGYTTVMRLAKDLQGPIVSPQDPMIAYRLTGFAGTPLVYEWDYTNLWPLPRVMTEIKNAKYVITYGTTNPVRRWPFEEGFQFLVREGFSPMPVPGLENSQYQIWSRDVATPPPANSP